MAGRSRTRRGLPKPRCEHTNDRGTRCQTIPATGYRHCPHHHLLETRKLASQWEHALDQHHTTINIRLPALGKTLFDLSHEERTALGYLVTWQHPDLELPAAPDEC